MDKIEVAGYSAAAVCLLATLAVYFMWIMPTNKKIATNLVAIQGTSDKLQGFIKDWGDLKSTADSPEAAALKSVADIDSKLDKVESTDKVLKVAKDDRTMIGVQTRALVKSVVAAHEVAPAKPSGDLAHDIRGLRADVGKLFTDNKVPQPSWKSIGIPEENEVHFNDTQLASATLCRDVLTKLLSAGTQITISHGVAENQSINTVPVQLTEKVSLVQQFFFYNETGWTARQKVAADEFNRVSHPGGAGTPGANRDAATADMAHALKCNRTGFRLVFQTLPINVSAALASLENLNGNLVTIKRLEIVRANSSFFRLADFNGDAIPVPQPYREGNVQVTLEAELLSFATEPKASAELEKILWKDAK